MGSRLALERPPEAVVPNYFLLVGTLPHACTKKPGHVIQLEGQCSNFIQHCWTEMQSDNEASLWLLMLLFLFPCQKPIQDMICLWGQNTSQFTKTDPWLFTKRSIMEPLIPRQFWLSCISETLSGFNLHCDF